MARIPMFAPMVPKGDGRTVAVEPKRVDPHYQSERHVAWRDQVLRNGGHRCEWIENGQRCTKAAPQHRMFADHIKERQDGGASYDPANGQCLCGSHHTRKTVAVRSQRIRHG